MNINQTSTTSIAKINGAPISNIVKLNGVTMPVISPIPLGIVTTNLIMYLDAAVPESYPGSGTTWTDITYTGNNGTLVNGPTYSSNYRGSIQFDGTNDYVGLTNVNLNRASGQDFVWNAWIKTPAVLSGYKMIMSTGANYYYLALFDNKIAFDVSGITLTRFGTLAVNTWYNITIVRDTNVDYVYVNGALISTRSNNGGYNGTLSIGKWTYNNTLYYNSYIPVVSIYNAKLTAAEVLQNYNALLSRYIPIFNADASTWSAAAPTSWTDFNNHTGTLINGTAYDSANGGNMQFDGSNDYISFPNDTALNSQRITMESWVYLNTLVQNGFIFEKGSVNTQYSNFFYSDGNFYFRTIGLSVEDLSINSSSYMTDNAWYHIACTYESGTKSIYVNGVLAGQITGLMGTIPTNNTGLFLGAYYSGGGIDFLLNGRIAISRAYNISLTQAQVQQNFNGEKTRFGY